MKNNRRCFGHRAAVTAGVGLLTAALTTGATAQDEPASPQLSPAQLAALAARAGGGGSDGPPAFSTVSDGYEEVVSTADGSAPYLRVWRNAEDQQLLAELPRRFEGERFFIIGTVNAGIIQTGVHNTWSVGQGPRYVYWTKHDEDTLALVEPNLAFRTSGDAESRRATSRVYTDSVLFTVPIIAKGPNGGPVIDLDQMLQRHSTRFFGGLTAGANWSLNRITSAKAFPLNSEISMKFPRRGGQLTEIHFSIGKPPVNPNFNKRIADRRVGFFYTDYIDRGETDGDDQRVRYAERWHLEKRDPSLRMSPPKQPIVYYIEHTTPVRYRRWVRDAILAWNRAFERVGIIDAIEVRQQDATTGAYMDIDPADMRYSFVRWTNANMGFAIGPSHANPETGEIFEADIVLDEGFIAGWINSYADSELASAAMSSMHPETVEWFQDNPRYDPRYLLARPSDRPRVLEYAMAQARGEANPLEAPPTMTDAVWFNPTAPDAHSNRMCSCMHRLATDMSLARLANDVGLLNLVGHDHGDEEGEVLDGMPEEFVGPLLKWVTMHEVGHTLGLMHNWKGTSRFSFEEVNNTPENGGIAGVTPWSVSVMDYTPPNIVVETDEIVQGDYAGLDIGSYDMWAIEWGYTSGDYDAVARQAANPDHAFMSDEGSFSPDPTAKVWDLGANSLDMADNRILFVNQVRERILTDVVEDGDSYADARQAYLRSLGQHISAVNVASHWVGGAYVNRYRRGDDPAPGMDTLPPPIRPVEPENQRRAVQFIIDHALNEDAFGLTPELLSYLGTEQWYENWGDEQNWPVTDTVFGVQATALSMVINPTKLRWIMDNEVRVPAGEDAFTVPELLGMLREAVWADPAGRPRGGWSERNPMIGSFDRNLQREHVDRLVNIATGLVWGNASGQTLRSLARQELRTIHEWIDARGDLSGADSYTSAHLSDLREKIEGALDAQFIRYD